MMKNTHIFLTPDEVAQIALLRMNGTISSAGAKKVMEILWNERVAQVAIVVQTMFKENGKDISIEEAEAVTRKFPWGNHEALLREIAS